MNPRMLGSAASCLVWLTSGCAPLRVELTGPLAVNHGVPLPVVVRAVERSEHQDETYAAAAQRASQPDPARLWTATLTPQKGGLHQLFRVTVPAKKALGVYFLFTAPYGAWKALFEPPLHGTVRVRLELQGIGQASR